MIISLVFAAVCILSDLGRGRLKTFLAPGKLSRPSARRPGVAAAKRRTVGNFHHLQLCGVGEALCRTMTFIQAVGKWPKLIAWSCPAACQAREVAPVPVSFGVSAQTCQLRHFSTSRQFTLPLSHTTRTGRLASCQRHTPDISLKKPLVPIHSSPFILSHSGCPPFGQVLPPRLTSGITHVSEPRRLVSVHSALQSRTIAAASCDVFCGRNIAPHASIKNGTRAYPRLPSQHPQSQSCSAALTGRNQMLICNRGRSCTSTPSPRAQAGTLRRRHPQTRSPHLVAVPGPTPPSHLSEGAPHSWIQAALTQHWPPPLRRCLHPSSG